jgi:hypothetical protein
MNQKPTYRPMTMNEGTDAGTVRKSDSHTLVVDVEVEPLVIDERTDVVLRVNGRIIRRYTFWQAQRAGLTG